MFATAVIGTLALTIGASAAIFGLVDRVILRPLDVRDPSGLLTVLHTFESRGVQVRQTSMTWERAQRAMALTTLETVALSTTGGDQASRRLTVSATDRPSTATVDCRFVTANYFRVLGVAPALGRDFGPSDDTAAASPAVVVSHRFWRGYLGGDRGVIGRALIINGTSATVIGVAPRTFRGIEVGSTPPDLFLPLMMGSRLASVDVAHNDGAGRLFTPYATGMQPSAISPVRDLMVLARPNSRDSHRSQSELEASFESRDWSFVPVIETLVPFDSRADLRRFLLLLTGAVGLTLLVGCANLAGLLLARADDRRPELAIRATLGAPTSRLLQQVIVEAGLLAVAGGLAAWVVAERISQGLSAFVLPGGVGVSSLRESGDGRALAFTMAATTLAAVVISVGPVVRAAGYELASSIRAGAGASRRLGTLRALVALQVAVCIVLVFGAGLFMRSVSNALATDIGFSPQGLISVEVSPPKLPGPSLDGLHAIDRLVEQTRASPGVLAATAGPLPLVKGSDVSSTRARIDRTLMDLSSPIETVYISTDYFRTLGQRLVDGREFSDDDRDGTRPVAIINEAAARQFWPAANAVERQIGLPPISTEFSVVGIVRDAKLKNLKETDRAVVYLPRLQHQYYLAGFIGGAGTAHLIVRAQDGVTGIPAQIARLAKDSRMSVGAVTTLQEGVDRLLMAERLGRALLLLLAAGALLLTFLGIYGLVSAILARSTKELGVRMALGATGRDTVLILLRAALLPIGFGIALGSIVAWLGGRSADRFMYGLSGSDPGTMVLTVATIVLSALLAATVPTLRALRINPIDVLRTDH